MATFSVVVREFDENDDLGETFTCGAGFSTFIEAYQYAEKICKQKCMGSVFYIPRGLDTFQIIDGGHNDRIIAIVKIARVRRKF